jgi:hypothetical protein
MRHFHQQWLVMVLLMSLPETYGSMMVHSGPMLATYKAHKVPLVSQVIKVLQVSQAMQVPQD